MQLPKKSLYTLTTNPRLEEDRDTKDSYRKNYKSFSSSTSDLKEDRDTKDNYREIFF